MMLFWRRTLALLMTVAILVCGMTACTGDGGDNPATEAPVQTEATTKREPTQTKPETSVTDVVMVKNADSKAITTEICSDLCDYLTKNAGVTVKIVADYNYSYEAKEGRVYLFVGDPMDCEITERAKAKAEDDNDAVLLFEKDCVAIYSQSECVLRLGVNQFLQEYVKDGAMDLPKKSFEQTVDFFAYDRDNWSQPIPAYEGGELDKTLYSAGAGAVISDTPSNMHLIRNTTLQEFRTYTSYLDMLGYQSLYSNQIDDNYYCGYTDTLGLFIHTYYMAKDQIVRTVVDRNSTPLDEFCYETEGSESSTFYMFNHNTAGENTFLIHCADNSWIVIDGGVTALTGKYPQGMYQFMKEKSNLAEGEKLVISAWYLTHAHRDHFQAFHALISQFHDRIDLQRMIANLPDPNVVTHNTNWKDFVPCMELINKYYPNMMYMKAHTGMTIKLADVSFEILCSQEDLLDYWILNKEVWSTQWSKWREIGSSNANYSAYRNADKMYDINNSSLMSKITVNDMTVLELGDGFRAGDWMFPHYSMDTVLCDILLIAHHFNNDELISFYIDYVKKSGQLYALNAHVGATYTGSRGVLANNFNASKNQYLITARFDTIYAFNKKSGVVTMTTHTALYSQNGGSEINNLK